MLIYNLVKIPVFLRGLSTLRSSTSTKRSRKNAVLSKSIINLLQGFKCEYRFARAYVCDAYFYSASLRINYLYIVFLIIYLITYADVPC